MARHFLFLVNAPAPGISSEDPDAASRWHTFEQKANELPLPREGSRMPCRNAWLLPVEGGGDTLHKLQSLAAENRFSHSTYLFDGSVTKI